MYYMSSAFYSLGWFMISQLYWRLRLSFLDEEEWVEYFLFLVIFMKIVTITTVATMIMDIIPLEPPMLRYMYSAWVTHMNYLFFLSRQYSQNLFEEHITGQFMVIEVSFLKTRFYYSLGHFMHYDEEMSGLKQPRGHFLYI